MKRTGIVLCGGKSARMGRPKALLPWHGHTMIEHVISVLDEVVDEIVVVASSNRISSRDPSRYHRIAVVSGSRWRCASASHRAASARSVSSKICTENAPLLATLCRQIFLTQG